MARTTWAVGDFELDICNGRSCVTPEFPYNIGRSFRGNATGATATVPGTAANYAKTGPATQKVIQSPAVNNTTGDVTLTWSSVEGGTYKLEATSDLTGSWTTLSSNVSAATNAVQTTAVESGGATAKARRFYRTTRTFTAIYDGGGGGTGAPTAATSAANDVNATGATLNGTVTANNLSTTASFEYGTTTGYGSAMTATQQSYYYRLRFDLGRYTTAAPPPVINSGLAAGSFSATAARNAGATQTLWRCTDSPAASGCLRPARPLL